MTDQPAILTRSQFWTDDLDQAVEHLRERYVDHSRVALGKSPFGWGYWSIATAHVAAGLVRSSGTQVLRATLPESSVFVHVPLGHTADYVVGRRRLSAPPGNALVLPPMHAYTARSPGGSTLAIVVGLDALQDELEQIAPGRRGYRALRAMELPLSGGSRLRLHALLQRLRRVDAVAPDAPDPQALALLEEDIVGWLAGEIVRRDGTLPLSPRRRRRIEWIERWIDAHLGEKIDLERMAQVAGVGPRALTKATTAARGVAPMELVQARRLEAAWRALSRADAPAVARVASDCGFTHFGRFAAAYRVAFGESPSGTLVRCRPS